MANNIGYMTGMRGVYLAAAELVARGYITSPTSRSAFGADLLVTSMDCSSAFSVQVKTNASSFGWFLVGKDARDMRAPSHVYVLVNLRKDRTEFFVVPAADVANLVQVFERKPGSIWYAVKCTDVEAYRNKWESFNIRQGN